MDTKWKNTEISRKLKKLLQKILKKDEIFLIPGILGIVLGTMMLTDMLSYRYMTTEYNLGRGGVMNFCFAAGVTGILQFGLRYFNKNWQVQSEQFFQE